MSGGVDGDHPLEREVPHEGRLHKGRDHPARRPVDVHWHVQAGVLLDRVEGLADFLDRLVDARVCDAHDGDHANGVLVHEVLEERAVKGGVVNRHGHKPHLDIPVVAELLPAHLHPGAHDEVRLVDAQPGVAALGTPASAHRKSSEHRGLRRADRGGADSVRWVRGVPEVREDAPAAGLDLRGLRIFVLVDHVLVDGLRVELLGAVVHPRGHEGREVEACVAIQHRLVVDQLIGHVREQLALGDSEHGDLRCLRRVGKAGIEIDVGDVATAGGWGGTHGAPFAG